MYCILNSACHLHVDVGTRSFRIIWKRMLEIDESMARRQLKSPRSLSGRSIHLTFVKKIMMVVVMNDLLPTPLCNVNRPTRSEIQQIQNFTMKIHGKGYVCGQMWRSRLTFKIQRSRLWSRSNPLVISEAWSSIDIYAIRFVAIGPLWADIWQILYLTLKIQGQGHGQSQTWWSHFSINVQPIYLLFVSWQFDHFWLRYSKFYIWPWYILYLILKNQGQAHGQGQTRWSHLSPNV